MMKKLIYLLFCLLAVTACKIENDIPYPTVEGNILSIEVEGQRGADGSSSTQAVIDKSNRTVQLYVDDSVDLSKLRITKLTISDEATLVPNAEKCMDASKFPTSGFESLATLSSSANTQVDFSKPVTFTLKTYQEYVWTVSVTQVITRNVTLANQIGKAVIDETNRNVVVYVSKDQPLNAVKVSAFQLGGEHGRVVPDPTNYDAYDFSEPAKFFVSYAWEEYSREWTVYVYHSNNQTVGSADVFPRTTTATLNGEVQSGKTPVVEYKKQSDSTWSTLGDSAVNVSGTSYTASLTRLSPATAYQYRVSVDGTAGSEQSFTTAAATPLTNGSFDDWYQDGKLWNPWASGSTAFWDTGNRGATTISDSNSVPTTDTSNGTGKAAYVESKYLLVKFAAGNIFTGDYVKTDGTNGILNFGRPFTAFPTKLRIHYKYNSATIDKVGDTAYKELKGRADSCHIYIALTDWDQQLEIRTRSSERQLFDKNDSHVIAYAELVQGTSDAAYRQLDLTLNYRYTNRTPKYILVVASASKYGDFFTGGTGSKLWVDDFELIYE